MSVRLRQDPSTSDGRKIILSSRYRGDVDPYFAGCDDAGNLFSLSWASAPAQAETKNLEWSFADWVYVSKGTVRYRNAGVGDYLTFKVYAPATTLTSNPGAGNCNKVDTGQGFNIIVPAAGDGSDDVNVFAPVPAFDADGNGNGWWDWDLPDTGLGALTPNTEQKGSYNLYDAPLDLVRWIRKLPILGDGIEDLHPETKARRVLPHWKFKVEVRNESKGAVEVIWHLDCARKKTT
jgi:hypothetical protein